VDSVAAEVNRLVDSIVRATAEQLPEAFERHVGSLTDILDSRFDGKRSGSVQQQLAKAVREISKEQQSDLARALLDEGGPLGLFRTELDARIRLLLSRHDEVLKELTAVNERLLASRAIEQERDRGTAKGSDFESFLGETLMWVVAPYDDLVSDVGTLSGADGNRCGDYEVVVSTNGAGGSDGRIAIEAKCRGLSLRASLAELDRAMSNRDARVGLLVFSSDQLAPLGGRSFQIFPGNRLIVVLDPGVNDRLALEVGYSLARHMSLSAAHATNEVDSRAIETYLAKLHEILDQAKAITRGSSAARRGLDQVDSGYVRLRDDALSVLTEVAGLISRTAA
jgi:hypothetical protein